MAINLNEKEKFFDSVEEIIYEENCNNVDGLRLLENVECDELTTYQGSSIKGVLFWIVSLIFAIWFASEVNCGSNSGMENSKDFLSIISPYVVMCGSLIGTILYGICAAKDNDYNFWSYIMAAISGICGIIGCGISVAVIYSLVNICLDVVRGWG